VLAAPILPECFELIARRNPERVKGDRGIELIQLPARHDPNGAGTDAASAAGVNAIEDVLGARTPKGANHQRVEAKGTHGL